VDNLFSVSGLDFVGYFFGKKWEKTIEILMVYSFAPPLPKGSDFQK
jgi:hypothetical protein